MGANDPLLVISKTNAAKNVRGFSTVFLIILGLFCIAHFNVGADFSG